MASRPELTKASYIDTGLAPKLTHSRIDTARLASDMELARRFSAQDDAFVHEQTTVKPEVSLWGLGWRGAVFAIKNFKLIVGIFSLISKGLAMKDPKTTLAGVLTAAGMMLDFLGLGIPQEITKSVIIIGVFLIGKFAGDGKPAAEQPKQ